MPLKPTDFYETPPELFEKWNEEFHFDLDVCAEESTAKCSSYYSLDHQDSLESPWNSVNWCNPPYSNVTPWLEKAVKETLKGNVTVMLLKSDTSTKWYHDLVLPYAAEVRFLKGRIRFLLNKKPAKFLPPWGNILVIYNSEYFQRSCRFFSESINE